MKGIFCQYKSIKITFPKYFTEFCWKILQLLLPPRPKVFSANLSPKLKKHRQNWILQMHWCEYHTDLGKVKSTMFGIIYAKSEHWPASLVEVIWYNRSLIHTITNKHYTCSQKNQINSIRRIQKLSESSKLFQRNGDQRDALTKFSNHFPLIFLFVSYRFWSMIGVLTCLQIASFGPL